MRNLELSFTVLVRYVLSGFLRIFLTNFLCRRSRHGATDEGKDEERWTGLVSLLSLKPTMTIETTTTNFRYVKKEKEMQMKRNFSFHDEE